MNFWQEEQNNFYGSFFLCMVITTGEIIIGSPAMCQIILRKNMELAAEMCDLLT